MFQILLPNRCLRELFVMRARARLRRLRKSLSSRKRRLLTAIAILLPLIWLGNVVASMVLRERLSPDAFQSGVLLTGIGYFLWYVVKACVNRPPRAIEWTPAEESLLCGGPFPRSELVRYRLAIIFSATLLKALVSSTMFLPELATWWSGFLGLLLGLAFLDLARMAVETVLCGITSKQYRRVRIAVLAIAGGGLLSAAVSALSSTRLESSRGPIAVILPLEFLSQLAGLRDTLPGHLLSAPLHPFVEVITATRLSVEMLGWLLVSCAITVGLSAWLVRLDQVFATRAADSVRRSYPRLIATRRVRARADHRRGALPKVLRLRGAGPIAWRQWLGARRYQIGLLVALGVPAALCCLPLLRRRDAVGTFLNVSELLCLCSFLLLPAALKFDFRRDYDRLPILKSMPVSPWAVVLGQLATPVVIATLMQLFVLGIAFLTRPVPVVIAANAVLMIVPLNFVIFGLDNLIFLMYPYRQSEEGLQPFIRATLTFTAKGVLFAAALVVVYCWAIGCRFLADLPSFSSVADHRLLFAAGLWGMSVFAAGMLVALSARAFARFDPSFERTN